MFGIRIASGYRTYQLAEDMPWSAAVKFMDAVRPYLEQSIDTVSITQLQGVCEEWVRFNEDGQRSTEWRCIIDREPYGGTNV